MLTEPNTWNNPNTHYLEVLRNEWYKQLILLENLITEETMKFYEKKGLLLYIYLLQRDQFQAQWEEEVIQVLLK